MSGSVFIDDDTWDGVWIDGFPYGHADWVRPVSESGADRQNPAPLPLKVQHDSNAAGPVRTSNDLLIGCLMCSAAGVLLGTILLALIPVFVPLAEYAWIGALLVVVLLGTAIWVDSL